MINKAKFLEIWRPLLQRFRTPTQEQLDIDFDRLRVYEPEILARAVENLLQNHRSADYPTFGEIFDAIEQVFQQRPMTNIDDEKGTTGCRFCHDAGLSAPYPNPDNKGYYCDCEKGRKKRAGHLAYRKTGDMKKARIAYEEER